MAFVCRICGSDNFVFRDEYVVCEDCGMKYSPEAFRASAPSVPSAPSAAVRAKPAPVSGELESSIINGIREYNLGHYETALPFFIQVLYKQPHNAEALFYKGMCEGMQSSLRKPKVFEMVQQACEAMRIIRYESAVPDQYYSKGIFIVSECSKTFHRMNDAILDCIAKYNEMMEEHRASKKRFLRGRLIEFGVDMALSTFLDVDTSPTLEYSLMRDRENRAQEAGAAHVAEEEEIFLEIMNTVPQEATDCLSALINTAVEVVESDGVDVPDEYWETLLGCEELFRSFGEFCQDPQNGAAAMEAVRTASGSARQARADLYWSAHPDEANRLRAEQALLEGRMSNAAAGLRRCFEELNGLEQQKNFPTENETALQELGQQLEAINAQLAAPRRYARYDRDTLQQQRYAVISRIDGLRAAVADERVRLEAYRANRTTQLNADIENFRAQFSSAQDRAKEIEARLLNPPRDDRRLPGSR